MGCTAVCTQIESKSLDTSHILLSYVSIANFSHQHRSIPSKDTKPTPMLVCKKNEALYLPYTTSFASGLGCAWHSKVGMILIFY